MPGKQKKRDLDDIQVLGVWNFTIQPETPLVWLRTGALDRYLMRFSISTHLPSTAGMIFHSEADGPGIDGVSFWIERRTDPRSGELTRRYVLAGDGLESKPLATKKYPDPGGEATEDVEVLVQGFTAVIFVRNRQVQIRARTKSSRGSICFFNSTKPSNEVPDDVHFSNCRITALRRGPLEVAGILARREKALNEPERRKTIMQAAPETENAAEIDPLQADGSIVFADGEEEKGMLVQDSVATTATPDSPGISIHLSKSGAATTNGNFFKGAPSPAATNAGFRQTVPKKLGSPNLTSSSMFSGRGGGPARLKSSLSDSALRKSGSMLCGLSHASKARGFGDDEWIPLITNPPKSEQKFVRENAIRPSASSRACQDFIKM